jgi:dsDNA-binding SOS-regulon protein
MADFKVTLDVSALTQFLDNFTKEVTKDIKNGIEGLAKSTQTHIVEEVQNKLNKHEAERYKKWLSQAEKLDDYLWVITLHGNAESLEKGEKWDMKGKVGQWGLLKDSKTVKNGPNAGKHYRVIPMQQGEVSDSASPNNQAAQIEIKNTIKNFLKSQNPRIPYGIEKHTIVDPETGAPTRVARMSEIGPNGNPKPLHTFDIPSRIPGKGNTQQLTRLNIYQIANKNGNPKKVMTTFRTVMDTDAQKDKWMYPAPGAHGFFEEAAKWAQDEWTNTMLPKLLEKYK